MAETASLNLPLLQPSQAQKHVTVNEALVRLDGLAQLRLESRSVSSPPGGASDGQCYAVPDGAGGAWAGHDGEIAIYSNGGWTYARPQTGWEGWLVDEGRRGIFVDGRWASDVLATSQGAAHSSFRVATTEHEITTSGAQDVELPVPADSMLFACSARVVEPLTGTLTAWKLGTSAQADQFGSGMGIGAGSYCTGLLGQPFTVYSETQPRIAPIGGSLTGGKLRLAVHFYRIELP
ncbi:uncharacterized protein DUF2793 [Aliiruegeria haliotis]|uniref:Uncharacterized protein DUF2793 n=1 Tax=Aliiruegeria haliotis TaxID=1280846 RepID=A0A2T0RYG8_9RHOB|nr:DUF2793 domain-containing protein [Aliiruegeria haliotis]PRY26224.1 uncharacterized protein DUF2793 [Aliiruegeria haliotis]